MSKRDPRRLTERQIAALRVLGKYGGKYTAAFVGAHLRLLGGSNARMMHGAASSVLLSLERLGLAERSLSQTWGNSVYHWSSTRQGKRALAQLPHRDA